MVFFNRTTKEERYLESVKARLSELIAEGMKLEYERADLSSRIANNAHRVRTLKDECIPALEKIVQEQMNLANAKGVEVSPKEISK